MAIPRPMIPNTPIGNATSEINHSPNSFNFVAIVQLLNPPPAASAVLDIAINATNAAVVLFTI